MKQKFIEWFTKNNNGCSPAMEDDRSFVYEKTQSMFEAYQAGVAEGEARCAALAAENAGLKADQVRIFNSGYQRGHEATVEGYYVDIHQNDMTTYHEDIVAEIAEEQTPATDAFLAEVRAQGVDEFLRGSQLPYQIATVLADYDNVDDATLQTVIWSGQPPEPDGDVWHLEYVSRGNAIVRAVLKELRKGVQQ